MQRWFKGSKCENLEGCRVYLLECMELGIFEPRKKEETFHVLKHSLCQGSLVAGGKEQDQLEGGCISFNAK